MNYLLIIAVSFIVVFLATPNIRYAALNLYAIDKTNHRKIHKKLVTKLGGLAIYLGFLAGIFTVIIFDPNFFRVNFSPLASLLIGSTLILLLGIYDDFQGSSAILKFSIQIVISLLVIKAGFILNGISIPGIIDVKFGIFSVPLTTLWLVGITNAVNLIDGLDGLAAGVAGIVLSFIFISSLILKDSFVGYASLALAGASFAFLKYNFYPAKIFMGDTGSLFLGLTAACLGLYRPALSQNNSYFIPAVIVLFLPILDTTLAIIRRIRRRQNIFSGDSSHIHHFLIKSGFSQTQTVKVFYLITFVLGIVSLFATLAISKR